MTGTNVAQGSDDIINEIKCLIMNETPRGWTFTDSD